MQMSVCASAVSLRDDGACWLAIPILLSLPTRAHPWHEEPCVLSPLVCTEDPAKRFLPSYGLSPIPPPTRALLTRGGPSLALEADPRFVEVGELAEAVMLGVEVDVPRGRCEGGHRDAQ